VQSAAGLTSVVSHAAVGIARPLARSPTGTDAQTITGQ
jgi:hypothetical protein